MVRCVVMNRLEGEEEKVRRWRKEGEREVLLMK
jgi:hypothetical protein